MVQFIRAMCQLFVSDSVGILNPLAYGLSSLAGAVLLYTFAIHGFTGAEGSTRSPEVTP